MGWAHCPAIYGSQHVEGWKAVTKSVHDANGLIFCQLWHMGRVTHSSHHGIQPVSASALIANGDGAIGKDGLKHPFEVPRALELNEIQRLVTDFKTAAKNAKEAGFDGIEVHAANGYLLDQFLQSKTNIRTDAYGGSKENRFRVVKEIVEAVSTEFPSNRVAVRISPNGVYNDVGSDDNFEAFNYYLTEVCKSF